MNEKIDKDLIYDMVDYLYMQDNYYYEVPDERWDGWEYDHLDTDFKNATLEEKSIAVNMFWDEIDIDNEEEFNKYLK